jgi:hypothetical protein
MYLRVFRCILLTALPWLLPADMRGASPVWHDGDIIFQTSTSSQSRAIQLATHSHYSHMGIMFHEKGRWFVFEAANTVRKTPLSNWIHRGVGGRYIVRRLKDPTPLTPAALQRMKKLGENYFGRTYDLTFEWSDNRLYCSELVWKLYHRAVGLDIGRLQKLRDADLTTPDVKRLMKARYGDHIPLDEPVISPQAIFDSELLVTVAEN